MLREGYHKSFCELFALIKRQNDERIAAGPDSSLWGEELLEKQPDKLQTLKQYLTQAEISDRKGWCPRVARQACLNGEVLRGKITIVNLSFTGFICRGLRSGLQMSAEPGKVLPGDR